MRKRKRRILSKHLNLHLATLFGFNLGETQLSKKSEISSGQWLSDNHMSFIQALLKDHFQQIGGLRNTLTLTMVQASSSLKGHGLQVIFWG